MTTLPNFPAVRPAKFYDFKKTQLFPPELTFTRAGTATHVSHDGSIRIAPANSPRIEYDMVTGECLGLLIEESRTNLYKNSYELKPMGNQTGNNWFQMYCTLTATTIKTPLGTNATLMKTTAANTSFKEIQQPAMWEPKMVWSYSLLVKADTHNIIQLHGNQSIVDLDYVTINISTGEIGSGTPEMKAATTVKVRPDGWCLITVEGLTSYNTNAITGWFTLSIQKDLNQERGAYWLSAGTESILIAYCQLEKGAYATSYIPTTETATVTRPSESCLVVGTTVNSMIVDIGDIKLRTDVFPVLAHFYGTQNGYLRMSYNKGNPDISQFFITNGSSPNWSSERYTKSTSRANFKVGITNMADDYNGVIDNINFGIRVPDTAFTGWSGNALYVVAPNGYTGHVKSITTYARALTLEQLKAVANTAT